jgi:hypothetical protein
LFAGLLAFALAAGALAGFIAFAAAFAALAAELAAVVAALAAALAAFAIALAAFAIALAALAIALLALAAALFEAASPQAIPKAPITRTAESAITFFIKSILLSSSKHSPCSQVFQFFRNFGQYSHELPVSQPLK